MNEGVCVRVCVRVMMMHMYCVLEVADLLMY